MHSAVWKRRFRRRRAGRLSVLKRAARSNRKRACTTLTARNAPDAQQGRYQGLSLFFGPRFTAAHHRYRLGSADAHAPAHIARCAARALEGAVWAGLRRNTVFNCVARARYYEMVMKNALDAPEGKNAQEIARMATHWIIGELTAQLHRDRIEMEE